MPTHNAIAPGDDVLVAIIEALADHGLDQYDYQLYDAIDVEPLDRLLASSTDSIEVEFTIQNLRVEVTRTQVTATPITS